MDTRMPTGVNKFAALPLIAVAIDTAIMFWLIFAGHQRAFAWLVIANSAVFFVASVTFAIKFHLDQRRAESGNPARVGFLVLGAAASLYVGLPLLIRTLEAQ